MSAKGVTEKRYQDGAQASRICRTSLGNWMEMGKGVRNKMLSPEEVDAEINSRGLIKTDRKTQRSRQGRQGDKSQDWGGGDFFESDKLKSESC